MNLDGQQIDLEFIHALRPDVQVRRLKQSLDGRMQGPIPPSDEQVRKSKSIENKEERKAYLDSCWSRGPKVLPANAEISLRLYRFRTRNDQLALAIASWWLEDLGSLVRVELEKSNFLEVRLVCSSKFAAVEYMQTYYSNRDFFGNFLPLIVRLVSKLKFSVVNQAKARPTQRRRGYRDHGTLPDPSVTARRASYNDWSVVDEQQEIEFSRQATEDYLQLLIGFSS